jgi:hypothetical protein
MQDRCRRGTASLARNLPWAHTAMKTLVVTLIATFLLATSGEAADKKTTQATTQNSTQGSTLGSSIVVPGVTTPWPGKILVTHDEWAPSDAGFAAAPDAAKYAVNLAAWFTGGRPGKFLVYSTNWSLTEPRLAQAMTTAGHSWTVNTSMEFTVTNLLAYDAVFVAGDILDTSVLTDYVRSGGNVYLAGGTGWYGAMTEAGRWNPFLNAFGLNFDYHPAGISRVVLPVSSTSPIFQGVSALWMLDDYGMTVDPIDPSSPYTKTLISYAGHGLWATYAAVVIPVAVEICPTRLPLTSSSTLAAAIAGTSTFDVRTIDPTSVRVVGVAPRGAVYDYGAAASSTTMRLGKTTVSACLGGRGDGFLDLVLSLEAQDLVKSINTLLGRSLVDGETVALMLTGRLKPEFGGTPILGEGLVVTKR